MSGDADDGATGPPVDPRTDLPALGSLATEAEVDPVVVRILAPNPGPMTLDGTNTHLVGVARGGPTLVVDPGPDGPSDVVAAHVARVVAAVRARDLDVVGIVTTHHHPDHAGAAAALAAALAAPVRAAADGVVDGATVGRGGAALRVVATPGHTRDHLAFVTVTGAVLTGDHVLGRGTSVVAHPDGDLDAHLASLVRVRALGSGRLLPGHGPVIDGEDLVDRVLAHLLAHRAWRTERVAAALAAGPLDPEVLRERVYGPLTPDLAAAAAASLAATVASLVRAGRVAPDAVRWP